jgi:hypothetical protein
MLEILTDQGFPPPDRGLTRKVGTEKDLLGELSKILECNLRIRLGML